MPSQAPPVSLAEIVRLALPQGTAFLAGSDHKDRPISWVTLVLLPLSELLPIEPGDLALLIGEASDEALRSTLSRLVEAGAAAIALTGDVSPQIAAEADWLAVPLLCLPVSDDVRSVLRSVVKLLMDREAELASRGSQIYQQLARASSENQGLENMTRRMAEITGKAVLVQDKRLQPLAAWASPSLIEVWPEVIRQLARVDDLPGSLRDRRKAAQVRLPERQALPGDLARLVLPIVVGQMARGFLSVVGSAADLDALDVLVAQQGAAACALEMAKAKAVSQTEKRFRGDLLDAVIAGTLSPAEINRWAARVGYDLSLPHTAIAVGWMAPLPEAGHVNSVPSMRRLETLVNGEIARLHAIALVRVQNTDIAIFCASDGPAQANTAPTLADAICHQASEEFSTASLACGVSRPVAEVSSWRKAQREAAQALAMARRLRETRPLHFNHLSVYHLLLQLEGHPELLAFYHDILGRLVDYDTRHSAQLLETLAVYFDNNGNLSQTAEALFIHRNSLLYRMERIAEIGGFDLNDPDTRLAVHLALKIRRLITAE